MNEIYKSLLKLYRIVGVALVLALIVIVLANIVFREAFGIALVWANEVAIALFVWVAFVGAGVSFAENARIRFGMFVEMLPRVGRKSVELLVSYTGLVLLAGFLATSVYVGWVHRHQTFATMSVTVAWQWAAVPAGALLAILGWIRYGKWTLAERVGA